MRKNKGYQQDIHRVSWRSKKQSNISAVGENKTKEQCLEDIDRKFDLRIKETKSAYSKIANKTTLSGEDLRKYCQDSMLWEVKFDKNGKLIPLSAVLNNIQLLRERTKARHSYEYFKRFVHKDNQKFVYNSGSGHSGNRNEVRIPSMKRSNSVWKRFYELFPSFKERYNELNNRNGIKLKKVW